MPFIALIDPPITVGKTIVLPVSMSQHLEQGERLKSILDELERKGHKANTTILLCDYLDRYNCSESLALEKGENFLATHKLMLEGFKVKRWQEFIDERKIKFNEKLSVIQKKSLPDSLFMNKIQITHKKCLSSTQTLENSLRYQQEQYAAILCMDEFDELIYPKRISDGMAYLYSQFDDEKKPHYNYVKINQQKQTLFFEPKKKSSYNMPIALRLQIESIEKLLISDEISEASKQLFAETVQNVLAMHLKNTNTLPNSEINAFSDTNSDATTGSSYHRLAQ